MFANGESIGPYRIVDRLGHGGMATVYRAYHANLDRYVAIKVLHAALREDKSFLARFRREAQIIAKLEHPNIVPIYDYDEYKGDPYLVMKFIEGETLKAFLGHKPITLAETLRIMTPIASALTYAHERNILHRDIKPSNILMDKATEPYLADFGLARIAGAGESTMSQDMMLGTPHYISPEQAQGVVNLDASTDIYSLGVVLYEMVVGRVPFNADTPYAIVHDHIFTPLPLPSKMNPNVPMDIENVLIKALAKQPSDRYQSAVDMISAFRNALQQIDTNASLEPATFVGPEFPAGVTRTPTPVPAPVGVQTSSPSTPASTPASSATPPPATVAFQTPFNLAAPGTTSPPSGNTIGNISTPTPLALAAVPNSGLTLAERFTRQQRRTGLWMLGGFSVLMLSCLVGLYITVAAFSDANIRSGLFAARPLNPGNPPGTIPGNNPGFIATGASQNANATLSATIRVTRAPTETDNPTGTPTNIVTPTDQGTETLSNAMTATAEAALATPAATENAGTPVAAEPTVILTSDNILSRLNAVSANEAQQYIREHGDDPVGYFALGLTLSRAFRPQQQDIMKAFQRGLVLARNNPAILIAVAQQIDIPSKRPLVASANLLAQNTLYAWAFIYSIPSNADVRQVAGQHLYSLAQSKRPEAIDILTNLAKQTDQESNSAMMYAMLAVAAHSQDKLLIANTAMDEAVKRDPNMPEVHLARGILYGQDHNNDAAKTELDAAINAPDAPKWVIKEAKTLEGSGN